MQEITHEEFVKAFQTVELYKRQQNPCTTVQVMVAYKATVSVTLQVPKEWSIETIKEELKSGYYGFGLEDEPDTDLKEITELVVDGHEIKL